MSWSLSKRDVSLRVTRFLPEVAPAHEPKPVAGLAPMVRALFRDRRAKECAKVEPDSSDEPETYDDYTADPRGDYADSVGMSLHEKL